MFRVHWQLCLLQAALKLFSVDTLGDEEFSSTGLVLICVWKGSRGNVGLSGWSKANLQPHTEDSASCFMLAACSRLFPVSFPEVPIKQNRLIKFERVSETGSWAYSNRLPSLDVYIQENKKQKTSVCLLRATQASLLESVRSARLWKREMFCPSLNINNSEKAERPCHCHLTHDIYMYGEDHLEEVCLCSSMASTMSARRQLSQAHSTGWPSSFMTPLPLQQHTNLVSFLDL